MGCVFSICKKKTRSTSTPMFKVVNVDNDGKQKYRGKMEVTEENLALHVNGRKSPIVWLLNSIRQYGHDESMFCFEANQSSPHGHQGIFPFKSNDAKVIFDNVKENLKVMNSSTALVKDVSSGLPTTSMRTTEQANDEVIFSRIKWSMHTEPTDNLPVLPKKSVHFEPMDDEVISIKRPYDSVHYENKKPEDLPSTSQESSEDSLVYTKLEMSKCPIGRKNLSTPAEKLPYSTIDFKWTANLNRKMFMSTDNTGTRKTRHDSSLCD